MPIDEVDKDLREYFRQIEEGMRSQREVGGVGESIDADNLPNDEELRSLFEEQPKQNDPGQQTIDLSVQSGTVMLRAGNIPRVDATGAVYTNKRVYDPTQAKLLICYIGKDRLEVPAYAMLADGLKGIFGKTVSIEGNIFLATEELKLQHPSRQMGVVSEPQRVSPRDAGESLSHPTYMLRPLSRTSLMDYILQAEEATLSVAEETYFARILLLSGPATQLTLLTSMVNSVLQEKKGKESYFLQK